MNSTQDIYKSPRIALPDQETLKKVADSIGLRVTPEELVDFKDLVGTTLNEYAVLDEFPECIPEVKYPRMPGHRPLPSDNPHNAWYWKTDIIGAPSGKLKGKTVGIKDNIAVAGVPMMNGTKLLEGYVPEYDATVVTRILDNGGRILGKTACEDMCFSASSFTCSSGPILNPHDNTKSAGGSSSGSAALVAGGHIDMAIGGDQGGSVRLPSCWCGIVGLKPTYGLVPYTGAVPIELTVDHLGPMASSVYDCALLLEAIAGPDDLDHRQNNTTPYHLMPKYTELLTGKLEGIKVGILTEGFNNCAEDVETCVRLSAEMFLREAGAVVEDVSIPVHIKGGKCGAPILFDGSYLTMIHEKGVAFGYEGFYPVSLQNLLAKSLETNSNDMSAVMKVVSLIGEYTRQNYQNKFYSKAQNVRRFIRQQYNEAFKTYDVLVMPTIKFTATDLPPKNASVKDLFVTALNSIENTSVFNITGHPAISINAGYSGTKMPIGMQIVGRHLEDATVLSVAYAFELIQKLHNNQKQH